MNMPRVVSIFVLLFSCLLVAGCAKGEKVAPPPPTPPNQISITGCVATPDTLTIKDGQTASWLADAQYQINFLPTNTPSGPAVPVQPNPFVLQANIAAPKLVHAPSNCSDLGCFYKYTIARMKNGMPQPVCEDPGVRVLPLSQAAAASGKE